jgi:cell division GTPase FtsZ
MTSSIKLSKQEIHETEFIVKGYSTGANSNKICNNLTNEICGVEWFLSTTEPLSTLVVEKELKTSDLLIVITDINKEGEIENSLLIANTARNLDILVLVFTLSATEFLSEKNDTLTSKQKELSKITNIIRLEDNVHIPYLFTETKFSPLTMNLLWKVSAIVELITIKGLICVDYSDIKWALRNKGWCQTFFGYGEGNNKTSQSLKDVTDQLSKQLLKKVKGIIITLFAGLDIELDEFEQIVNKFKNIVNDEDDTQVIIGVIVDPNLTNKRVLCTYVSG